MNNDQPVDNQYYWVKSLYNSGCYSIAKRVPVKWDPMTDEYDKAHWKVLESDEIILDSSVTEYHLIAPPFPVIVKLLQRYQY